MGLLVLLVPGAFLLPGSRLFLSAAVFDLVFSMRACQSPLDLRNKMNKMMRISGKIAKHTNRNIITGDQPSGFEAGPLSTEPPGPGLRQSGGLNPTLQWQWPRLLQMPFPLQPFGHEPGPIFKFPTGMHFWFTHSFPSPQ